jgi:hypothetical protein
MAGRDFREARRLNAGRIGGRGAPRKDIGHKVFSVVGLACLPAAIHIKTMQTRNRLLDDLARVAAGALGVADGMRREAEDLLKTRFAALLGSEGFVTREEFDAVKAMVARAREENEALAARIATLESAVAKASALSRKAAATPVRHSAPRNK